MKDFLSVAWRWARRLVWMFLKKLFCRHDNVRATASTYAVSQQRGSVDVGLTMSCMECGRVWYDTIRAAVQEPYAATATHGRW